MITRSKQDWSIGSQVKVGFLTLTVINQRGGVYVLSSKGRMYEFEPHRGLYRMDA